MPVHIDPADEAHAIPIYIRRHIQRYDLGDWSQLRPRWVADYIDFRLREGKAPGTINVDLSFLRNFCRFLIDIGT